MEFNYCVYAKLKLYPVTLTVAPYLQLSGNSRGQKEGDKQHGQSTEENASDAKSR